MTTTARTWTLPIPYARPPISENDRMHWARKHRIAQQLRNDVLWLAKQANLPRGLARVRIEWHWQPSVRRLRDSDNPTPALKVAIDALTQYGLTEGDDSAHVSSGCVIEPIMPPPPRCWLTIAEEF